MQHGAVGQTGQQTMVRKDRYRWYVFSSSSFNASSRNRVHGDVSTPSVHFHLHFHCVLCTLHPV